MSTDTPTDTPETDAAVFYLGDYKGVRRQAVVNAHRCRRIERHLTEERDAARASAREAGNNVTRLRHEAMDAQAEAREYREALDNMCIAVAGAGVRHPAERALLQECFDAARAALAKYQPKTDKPE